MTECPHCKSKSGYYITVQVSGSIKEHKDWDNAKVSYADNGEMWDTIKYGRESKYRRCIDCDKRVGENLNA